MSIRLGYALTGSFCTLKSSVEQLKLLTKAYDIYPIMSEITYKTDTRFGLAQDFIKEIEDICGKKIMHTITDTEPIGPKNMLDILVISPCTANTMGKIANGIFDTSVTMATKAHLRNGKPVLIAPATNDGLAISGKNISKLMVYKNIFFVPFSQDDPQKKPTSTIAHFDLLPKAIEMALQNKQINPLLLEK